MGQISSINFKKSNAIQTYHNDRDLPPSYLIEREKKDRIEVNRNHEEALKLKNQIIQEAIQTYTEKFNRKFIATSYEWSAVCNIKPDSKMEDLEKLAKHFEEKYGFQCYQIAIHRDEGHIDEEGNKVINHHAHMEFVTLNKENGRSMFRKPLITPKTLREIQTETAEILQMQRGEDKRISKRKRIEPRKYAQMKEEERKNLKKEKEKYKELEESAKEEWEAQDKFINKLEREKNLYVIENQTLTEELEKTKQENQELTTEIRQELEETKENLKKLKELTLTKKEVSKRVEEERQKMIKEGGHTQEDYNLLKEVKEVKYLSWEALEQAIAKQRELMEELKELKQAREKIQNLEQEKQELLAKIIDLEETIKLHEKSEKQELALHEQATLNTIKKVDTFDEHMARIEAAAKEAEERMAKMKMFHTTMSQQSKEITAKFTQELEEKNQENTDTQPTTTNFKRRK